MPTEGIGGMAHLAQVLSQDGGVAVKAAGLGACEHPLKVRILLVPPFFQRPEERREKWKLRTR